MWLGAGAQVLFAQSSGLSEGLTFSDSVRSAPIPCVPSQGRSVGGFAADKQSRPSFVRIQTDFGNGKIGYCGGVVISNRWVLTAGHCLDGRPASALRVIEGEADVDLGGRVPRVGRAVVQHRLYTDAHGATHYDVALMHLTAGATSPPQLLILRSALDSRVEIGSQSEVANFGSTMLQSAMGLNFGQTASHL